eukprot:1144287-Pelagomonas_calceolata.AAC.1
MHIQKETLHSPAPWPALRCCECKSSLKHGVSNKFQACWLQKYDRHLWLEDHGMDLDGVLKAGCKWCGNVFNCHIGTMFMREMLDCLHRHSKALTAAPAPKANSMSDSI